MHRIAIAALVLALAACGADTQADQSPDTKGIAGQVPVARALPRFALHLRNETDLDVAYWPVDQYHSQADVNRAVRVRDTLPVPPGHMAVEEQAIYLPQEHESRIMIVTFPTGPTIEVGEWGIEVIGADRLSGPLHGMEAPSDLGGLGYTLVITFAAAPEGSPKPYTLTYALVPNEDAAVDLPTPLEP